MAAMKAITKSKDGLSDAELDDIINDNSEWMTLWTIRQLTALGFIDYKVDFFGNPAKYTLTDLGRSVYQKISGELVVAPKPPATQTTPTTPPPPAPAPTPATPSSSTTKS
jgi:hypothetical protein